MKIIFFLSALTLFLSIVVAEKTLPYCTWSTTYNENTIYYDLRNLNHEAGEEDFLSVMDTDLNTYYINICGNSSAACSPAQAVCQWASDGSYYGAGSLSTQAFYNRPEGPETGVYMLYSSGQKCGSKYRWTHIDIDCDTSAKPGYAYYAEEGSCNYTILMHSKYGCYSTNFPGTGGSSGIDVGWILIIIVICCVVIYLGAGIAWNFKFKPERSSPIELIPNLDFWKTVPLYIKDGVLWAVHGFPRDGYTSGGGYLTV